jgi:hypothetical protein
MWCEMGRNLNKCYLWNSANSTRQRDCLLPFEWIKSSYFFSHDGCVNLVLTHDGLTHRII